jgi:hypothetical protein
MTICKETIISETCGAQSATAAVWNLVYGTVIHLDLMVHWKGEGPGEGPDKSDYSSVQLTDREALDIARDLIEAVQRRGAAS